MAGRCTPLYSTLTPHGTFSPDAVPAGRRALRNACLRFITAADDEAAAASRTSTTATRPTRRT